MTAQYNFPPISVFCGASNHATTMPENEGHVACIQNFGKILAENGIPLVWGAGETGMMGAVSRSVLDHGGEAIGVSTHHLLYGREGVQPDVTTLLVADDMQVRKLAFAKLSCAFTIFPGGAGTADEAYEYLVEREYGEHEKPLVVVNFKGYFEPFLKDFKRAVADGFVVPEMEKSLIVVDSETEILPALEAYFKDHPDLLEMSKSSNPDKFKELFDDEIAMGPSALGDSRTVTLKDAMIPLEMVGPQKLARSVALWTAGVENSLEMTELKEGLEKLVHCLGKDRYRIIHSGQNKGLKGMVSSLIAENEYSGIGVASKHMAKDGGLAEGLKYLLVRRNEQSVDFTVKALTGMFVITPGGVDVREKLFEFLTEVDIKEHDKPILLWNHEGCYDDLLKYLHYLYERGYMNVRALRKVKVVHSVNEIMNEVHEHLPITW